MTRTLSPEDARRYYDRHAALQDRQVWYEAPALERLVEKGDFAAAHAVLEVGCGSGLLATELRRRWLPHRAIYVGVDIAPAMLALTARRLHAHSGPGGLVQADATEKLPFAEASFDRVVAAFVFDLLSEDDARAVIAEARRVLRTGGLICLASLAMRPPGRLHRLTAWLWTALQRLAPGRVGGCRPLSLATLLESGDWRIGTDDCVARLGVASQVVIAERL